MRGRRVRSHPPVADSPHDTTSIRPSPWLAPRPRPARPTPRGRSAHWSARC